MVCPIDNTTLVMADRQGIEIDYCPQCRGVWLDRGELDKIIERNAQAMGPAPAPAPAPMPVPPPPAAPHHGGNYHDRDDHRSHDDHRDRDREYDRDHNRGYDRDHGRKKSKREGFLGDLFDFGD